MLHGRLLAGLAARAIESDTNHPEFHVARLTVDLFRSPPMAPVQVATNLVRDGRRIRSIDVTLTSTGVEVARVRALLLRRAEQPSGQVWSPPEWSVPGPDEIDQLVFEGAQFPMPEMRPITAGGFGAYEQKRTWLRETRELVAGEALSPFVRVALAADFTNPFANSGDQGLHFINADITIYLRRFPQGEWIGFEVATHLSGDGIAVGQCTMYDLLGAIGLSSVCAVANPRLRPGVP
jgi:acyl-CoA thioesterase